MMERVEVVELCEVGAEDEGRAGDGPESEFGAHLIVGVGGLAGLILAGMRAEVAFRKHVGIGPVAGLDVGRPLGDAIEFIAKAEGIFGLGGLWVKVQPSQWSSVMRHICAYLAISAA